MTSPGSRLQRKAPGRGVTRGFLNAAVRRRVSEPFERVLFPIQLHADVEIGIGPVHVTIYVVDGIRSRRGDAVRLPARRADRPGHLGATRRSGWGADEHALIRLGQGRTRDREHGCGNEHRFHANLLCQLSDGKRSGSASSRRLLSERHLSELLRSEPLLLGSVSGRSSSTTMRQTRPLGRNVSSTSPGVSRLSARVISRVPKPCRRGVSTSGPPCSLHTIASRRPWPSPRSRSQRIFTQPPGVLSAPCFAALVASSCSTRWSASASRAWSSTAGPTAWTRASLAAPRASLAAP